MASQANDIRGFCEDKNGNIWIATNGRGLFKYHTIRETLTQYIHDSTNESSISSNQILSMSLVDDKIYLATDGGGLTIFHTKTEEVQRFYQSKDNNSILDNNLICLYVENEENIWLGSTLGLTNIIKIDGKNQFINYAFDDLSFRRFILGILIDDREQVWVSTDEGVYRLEQENKTVSKVNLGTPFNSTEFYYNATYKAPDGKLFFGSVNGLFSFYPNQLFEKKRENKIIITGFKTFDKGEQARREKNLDNLLQIKKKKHVVVDANTDLIQIDFTNIQLPSSSELEYAVQLENYEEDWQYLGKNRTIAYDNLLSGDYLFKIKSIDAFNQGKQESANFKITVLTPFWKSNWAKFFYICLIGTILYVAQKYFYQWRKMKKNLRKEKEKRAQEKMLRKMQVTFFTNISHDLQTPLILIMGNIKRLTKRKEQHILPKQELNIIENNINHLLTLSNELLDFRKIENG